MTSAPAVSGQKFAEVFGAALRGMPCDVVGLDPEPRPLQVDDWDRPADASDAAVLTHCQGMTLDIGCGPGRMSAHLATTGGRVLAIDVVEEAVDLARKRGVTVLLRDVFSPLPCEGRWETALLADGNIGIGGDPVRLLERVRELIAPLGRVVVDLAPHGSGVRTTSVLLRTQQQCSHPFKWTVVGAEAIGTLALAAGLTLIETHEHDGRWFAVLTRSG